jgi:outer membrane protein
VWAEDLAGIYRLVRDRDPAFATARSQRAVAEEKLVQARAALLPQVNLNVSAHRQLGEAAFNGAAYADRAVRSSSTMLQLSQPLWRPGTWAGFEQAELQLRQSEQALRQAETELMLRTCQSYFDALVAQENIAVAQGQVRAVEQQLALARRNYEAGMTTVTDVHEAAARLAMAQAQATGTQTEWASKQADLEKLLGAPPPGLARLAPDAPPPTVEPADVEAWIDSAQADNPQLLAQQIGVEIARREVEKLAQAHGPSLELTLGVGRSMSTGSMTSPTELASRARLGQVGVQLVIPLYAGGATQSRVREALAMRDKAEVEFEAARGQVRAMVRQAHASVLNGQAQQGSLAAAASASQSAVNANKLGYQIGTRINIDVLNAEQQQFSVARDLNRARAETIMQFLKLKAAAGSLQEADLQAVGLWGESP